MQESGQLHAAAALFRGESCRYTLERKLCGPQNRTGRGGEKENPFLDENRTPGRPVGSPVTIPTEAIRLPPDVGIANENCTHLYYGPQNLNYLQNYYFYYIFHYCNFYMKK
jgi:hypothetical protein